MYWDGSSWQVGSNTIRLGGFAGATGQGANSVALGASAGRYTQGSGAVAVGFQAAQTNQGSNAVAVGNLAAGINQGLGAIALGYNATGDNQVANSIVLNASGVAVPTALPALYAKPVRSIANAAANPPLVYNPATFEIFQDTNKTFVINHPLDKERYLVHACYEGPESGVVYRGQSKTEMSLGKFSTEVNLPSYASALADHFTVQVTPVNCLTMFYASQVVDGKFTVETSVPCSFYWVVYGRRGEINVEPRKQDVRVSGDGPYKYIHP